MHLCATDAQLYYMTLFSVGLWVVFFWHSNAIIMLYFFIGLWMIIRMNESCNSFFYLLTLKSSTKNYITRILYDFWYWWGPKSNLLSNDMKQKKRTNVLFKCLCNVLQVDTSRKSTLMICVDKAFWFSSIIW